MVATTNRVWEGVSALDLHYDFIYKIETKMRYFVPSCNFKVLFHIIFALIKH